MDIKNNPLITDKELKLLAGLQYLEELQIDGCSISEKALPTLEEMSRKKLQSLAINCMHWPKADALKLDRLFPGAHIKDGFIDQKQSARVDYLDDLYSGSDSLSGKK